MDERVQVRADLLEQAHEQVITKVEVLSDTQWAASDGRNPRSFGSRGAPCRGAGTSPSRAWSRPAMHRYNGRYAYATIVRRREQWEN